MSTTITTPELIEPIKRLTRDLATAAKTLSKNEARFLVDAYYQMQHNRITSNNQIRAMTESGEPHDVLQWLAIQDQTLEDQIKRALDKWTDSFHIGRWSKNICGIGPVIAAGLAAHIDITKAETAGSIWSFAGLDPRVKWEKGQKRPYNASLKTLCCHPDTIITTKRGYLPIKDVVVGDMVLTHLGNWKPVTKTMVNDFDGDMVKLGAHGRGGETLMVTPYHPVYAKTVPVTQYVGDGRSRVKVSITDNPKGSNALSRSMVEMRASGSTLAAIAAATNRSQATVSLTVRGLRRSKSSLYGVGWVKASDMKEGWRVYQPFPKSTGFIPNIDITEDRCIINGSKISPLQVFSDSKPHGNSITQSVKLDYDVARFCGLFIAEGHTSDSSRTIGLSFHHKETEYIQFSMSMLLKYWGLASTVNEHSNDLGIQVITCSALLGRKFGILFGKGAANKHIPADWMFMDDELTCGLLRGIWEGDGHTEGNRNTQLGTISPTLAFQVRDLLLRLNISSSISIRSIPSGKAFHVIIHDLALFYEKIMKTPSKCVRETTAVKLQDRNGFWRQLTKPERVKYVGKVYNFEVDDDESYVANGYAVHNCAFKLGESFVKVQGNKNDIYGAWFRKRKDIEIKNNEAGVFADIAKNILETKKIGKTTDAYKFYSAGKLPPAHIHARARRWTTKLFLSHYHAEAYRDHFGKEPPLPYPIAILGHAEEHMIERPTLN